MLPLTLAAASEQTCRRRVPAACLAVQLPFVHLLLKFSENSEEAAELEPLPALLARFGSQSFACMRLVDVPCSADQPGFIFPFDLSRGMLLRQATPAVLGQGFMVCSPETGLIPDVLEMKEPDTKGIAISCIQGVLREDAVAS